MKVMTIVGTRPEIIKLSCVMQELDKHVDHVLVHTGQNYDWNLNEVFFEQMELRKPDHRAEVGKGNGWPGAVCDSIRYGYHIMEHVKPDAVLLLGDTNSCLAAYAAKRLHIPIFHMEAGNRCFDQRVPEEINRKIVDHISDINMPYTEHARRNLLAEGLPADRIIKTGSPMPEVLSYYHEQIEDSEVLQEHRLMHGDYFVVSAHREENVDNPDRLHKFVQTVDRIAAKYCLPVVVSMHPRTADRLNKICDSFAPHIIVSKPFGFFDYVKLQRHAKCVISDSGTLTEEASWLSFPAVQIRQAHERPEGSDEGTLIMTDLYSDGIIGAINTAISMRTLCVPPDYVTGPVSQKVVKTILSYTDYVRRNVWREG